MKKKKKPTAAGRQKSVLKPILFILVIVGLIVLISYSIQQYNSQTEAEGITICKESECIKTLHIHSDITFDLCGKTTTLERETGELVGLHSHKEKNYLHFHDKVQLDPDTLEQRLDERLSLREILKTLDLTPGDYCEGSGLVETIFKVNGEVPGEGLDYNWKDGDNLHLIFKAMP